MKKIFILITMLFLLSSAQANDWLQILDKKYINIPTITTSKKQYVSFWIKAYRKEGEKLDLIGENFDYSLDKFTVDCKNKKDSLDNITIYDNRGKIIFSDELKQHDWHDIAPDTYADAYYRLFCLVPFKKNPLINPKR